jgi:extracellular factor (EF) 3-hydroxypalmitic acid methyl ester biosynthesis protein
MSIEHTKIKLSQSLVSFVTSRGQRIKARVKELRVDSLAFEILSSENILQLSEVLHEVEVTVGGKLAFRGELSVIGLVPLGVMVVCEARISGKWLLESFSTDDFLANIDEHLEAHTTQWAKDHEIRPVFRAVVADLEIYLSGLETWCEQVECGALSAYHDSGKREEEILAKLGPIVGKEIESHFADYERVVAMLDEESRHAHREHLKKTVHRFILQSPFSYRCFTKPLGYAGDYGMVQLMLGNPYQGATLFAKLLNSAFLKTGPVVAHQNRIDYLVETLKTVAKERADQGLRTRILNLGCGPAEEIQRFVESDPVAEHCDFELLDFNPETLRYTEKQLEKAQEKGGRQVNIQFVEESIQGFLRQATRGEGYPKESYDLVYCAGLFDYLQQRFCAKLTKVMTGLLREGGLVAVTNVSRDNSIPAVMADFLEWTLEERSTEEMLDLVPTDNLSLLKELKSDSTRINLFLELRNPAALRRDVGALEENDAAKVGRPGFSGTVRNGRSHLESSEL